MPLRASTPSPSPSCDPGASPRTSATNGKPPARRAIPPCSPYSPPSGSSSRDSGPGASTACSITPGVIPTTKNHLHHRCRQGHPSPEGLPTHHQQHIQAQQSAGAAAGSCRPLQPLRPPACLTHLGLAPPLSPLRYIRESRRPTALPLDNRSRRPYPRPAKARFNAFKNYLESRAGTAPSPFPYSLKGSTLQNRQSSLTAQ